MMFKFIGLPMDSMRLDSKPNGKTTSKPNSKSTNKPEQQIDQQVDQQSDQHARTALANELANFENKLPAH